MSQGNVIQEFQINGVALIVQIRRIILQETMKII